MFQGAVSAAGAGDGGPGHSRSRLSEPGRGAWQHIRRRQLALRGVLLAYLPVIGAIR